MTRSSIYMDIQNNTHFIKFKSILTFELLYINMMYTFLGKYIYTESGNEF